MKKDINSRFNFNSEAEFDLFDVRVVVFRINDIKLNFISNQINCYKIKSTEN